MADALTKRGPFHLSRPPHDGQHNFGRRALQDEAIGDRNELDTVPAELVNDRQGVADAGACEAVHPEDVQAAHAAAPRRFPEALQLGAVETRRARLFGEPDPDNVATRGRRPPDC
jgi:hypothetical protein